MRGWLLLGLVLAPFVLLAVVGGEDVLQSVAKDVPHILEKVSDVGKDVPVPAKDVSHILEKVSDLGEDVPAIVEKLAGVADGVAPTARARTEVLEVPLGPNDAVESLDRAAVTTAEPFNVSLDVPATLAGDVPVSTGDGNPGDKDVVVRDEREETTTNDARGKTGNETTDLPPNLYDISKDFPASLDSDADGGREDVPLRLNGTNDQSAASIDAIDKMLARLEDVPSSDKPISGEDTAADLPLVLDSDAPPKQPAEALHKARQTLQRTLDEVLREAEQWALQEREKESGLAGDDEYYEDDEQNVNDNPLEAINKTRAELQRTLEQLLTETEYEALLQSIAEEAEAAEAKVQKDDNAVAALRQSTEVPDDKMENLLGTVDGAPRPASTGLPPASTKVLSTTTEPPSTSTELLSTTTSSAEAPKTSAIVSTVPPASPTLEPRTTSTSTEENPYRHLVVELGESPQKDEPPGTAIIQANTATHASHQVPVPENVVETAVAAAAAIQADKKLTSGCPTKQPAPLRLPALPNAALESDDPQCARDSRLLDLHLRNHTLWAVQMQDAGAGGITGLLEGNLYHLGDFDECMDVLGPVGAQYCVAEVRVFPPDRTPDHRHHPDFPLDPMQSVWNRIKHEGEEWRLPLDTLHMAICSPASCGPQDLQDSIQRALNEHARCSNLPVAYTVTVSEAQCTSASKQRPPFSAGEIIYILLATLLALAVLGGTLIDLYATNKKSNLRWLIVLFSLKRNWHMLHKDDPKPMGLDLDSLSGARTINMAVLVIAHRGFNMLRGPVHNYNQYESVPRAVLQTAATHAQLFVDTCFAMSGLLVSLLELTRAHAHGKESDSRPTLMASLVHRYVRLTPSYAMVVFFHATIFWRFGSGPLWDQVIGHESDACAKYWWTNMFYVNNYINSEKLCMFQSWYLPCDLHMFFIGSVLSLLLARHRRTGLGFMLVFFLASMLIPFFVTLLGRKPALLEMLPSLFRAPDQSDNFRTMYAPTHIRAAPYMVGLLAGYLFQRLALKYKDRFTLGVTWLLCLGGVALTTASLLSSVVFYDPDMSYNGVAAGLYAALCPVFWSVGVCLIFSSLVLGRKTFMSSMLSWKPLVVLSRLTYNVYLTHWAVQVASVAKARAPFHLDVYNVFSYAFGDLLFCNIIALGLFLLIEAPFRSLARKLTTSPPESIVHLQAGEDRFKNYALEAGFAGANPKQEP